ncbi:MAG: COQ9 family protein [Robiginitomaculum sp.]|nr:COQ9 family protein [Robiginitomaculum sp.]
MTRTQIDPSLKARRAILDAMLKHVPFDGWSSLSLKQAVKDAGLPSGADELYFSGGPLEVITFWNTQNDGYMMAEMAKLDQSKMRIRDKITRAILFRLKIISPHEEAAKRAIARTALPDGLALSPKILWASADAMWRAIGDTSTDFNYYTKRTSLSAVISTSLLAWLSDDDSKKVKALAFIDARIENVMQFEGAKFKFKKRIATLPDPAEILGKIRYGTRRSKRRG